MSRRADRERKIAEWLEHLQNWQSSGEPLARYARSHGIEPWSMYHWRNVLRREGRWPEGDGEQAHERERPDPLSSARVPLRFARVKVQDDAPHSSLTIRVILRNGRRTEIELGNAQELDEVLAVLERSA
jgi:hypothetical protein